jgi:hypothetical protein
MGTESLSINKWDATGKLLLFNTRRTAMQKGEEKNSRRNFFKQISKYALGFGTFAAASIFGFRNNGDISLGKMKDIEFGQSEAHGGGKCGYGSGCAGGGGKCGYGSGCAGDGGGGGGGGKCGYGSGCAGGGGKCGYGSGCAGS